MRETIDTLDTLVMTQTDHDVHSHAGVPGVRGTNAELIWNYRGAMVGMTGTPYYPLSDGTITRLRMNLRTAATGDVIFDLLRNGTTMFPTTPKPTVTAGTILGPIVVPDLVEFVGGDKIEPVVVQSGNAADLVVTIEFVRVG
jgi:hypothetical protein